MPVSKKQIEEWKAKHGDDKVIRLTFDDGATECFLRRPTRRVIGLAMSKARTNPFGMIEVIVDNCWLGGDEVVKRDEGYLMGLAEMVDDIIGTKKAELKNC